jgi:hypothetical protein
VRQDVQLSRNKGPLQRTLRMDFRKVVVDMLKKPKQVGDAPYQRIGSGLMEKLPDSYLEHDFLLLQLLMSCLPYSSVRTFLVALCLAKEPKHASSSETVISDIVR